MEIDVKRTLQSACRAGGIEGPALRSRADEVRQLLTNALYDSPPRPPKARDSWQSLRRRCRV